MQQCEGENMCKFEGFQHRVSQTRARGHEMGLPLSSWWFQIFVYFHPYLGKVSILTNIFSKGLKPPTSYCGDPSWCYKSYGKLEGFPHEKNSALWWVGVMTSSWNSGSPSSINKSWESCKYESGTFPFDQILYTILGTKDHFCLLKSCE